MAEEESKEDKTEDPTDERRQEFRSRGEIAHSKELTSLGVLLATFSFMSLFFFRGYQDIQKLFKFSFTLIAKSPIENNSFVTLFRQFWLTMLKIILPICVSGVVAAIFLTFAQTRMNLTWDRIKWDFSKLNILSGLKRILSSQSIIELIKSLAKMFSVGVVTFLILYSERFHLSGLIHLNIPNSIFYFSDILKQLIWSVSAFLILVAGGDYLFHYITIEKRMKMTKQEVKEDYKKREVDPMIKSRMRRMQRELVNKKTIQATQKATVLITNPTHYAIAIHYELGMKAPKLIAKGADFMALRMREVAKEHDIPLVENKPLARNLYDNVAVGEDIPENLFQALSEVIRYVFRIKGVKIPKATKKQTVRI